MSSDGKSRRYRKASLSDSEIMTILIVFQFGSFRNIKHYYLFFIRQHLKSDFPNAVSYNRFVELQSRVFFQMMFFLNLSAFGRCTGISFVDSTMVPVCHNLRVMPTRYSKVWLLMGRGRWDGAMASNCIWSATTGARSLRSVSLVPMWMTGTRRSGQSWLRRSTGNSLPTGDTPHPSSLACFSKTGCIW